MGLIISIYGPPAGGAIQFECARLAIPSQFSVLITTFVPGARQRPAGRSRCRRGCCRRWRLAAQAVAVALHEIFARYEAASAQTAAAFARRWAERILGGAGDGDGGDGGGDGMWSGWWRWRVRGAGCCSGRGCGCGRRSTSSTTPASQSFTTPPTGGDDGPGDAGPSPSQNTVARFEHMVRRNAGVVCFSDWTLHAPRAR